MKYLVIICSLFILSCTQKPKFKVGDCVKEYLIIGYHYMQITAVGKTEYQYILPEYNGKYKHTKSIEYTDDDAELIHCDNVELDAMLEKMKAQQKGPE